MDTTPLMLIIFIILAYGIWGFMLKVATDKLGLWSAVAVGFAASIVMGGILLSVAFAKGAQFSLNLTSIGIIVAVVIANLAILATYLLLENHQVSIIMPLTEVYLVVIVLLGVFVLHETLSIAQYIGIAFAVIAGILLSI